MTVWLRELVDDIADHIERCERRQLPELADLLSGAGLHAMDLLEEANR